MPLNLQQEEYFTFWFPLDALTFAYLVPHSVTFFGDVKHAFEVNNDSNHLFPTQTLRFQWVLPRELFFTSIKLKRSRKPQGVKISVTLLLASKSGVTPLSGWDEARRVYDNTNPKQSCLASHLQPYFTTATPIFSRKTSEKRRTFRVRAILTTRTNWHVQQSRALNRGKSEVLPKGDHAASYQLVYHRVTRRPFLETMTWAFFWRKLRYDISSKTQLWSTRLLVLGTN